MENAYKELLEALAKANKNVSDIVAINISKGYWGDYDGVCKSLDDIQKLNFTYSDGYGSQELHGLVLFNDNTWLERGEYDGSEWWEYKKPPTIEQVNNFKPL